MIKWTSHTNHVDKETGEIINKNEINKYTKIKTKKNGYQTTQTTGHTEYTIEYRKKPEQGKLNLS